MVQETFQASTEAELPIDIDYAKFLSWLIDRRRVPRDWHTYLKSARALVRNALSLTPDFARTHLNLPEPPSTVPYFTAVDTLAALTAPSVPPEWNAGPDKDLLGRYKGPTSRAWADAVAAFERRDVYLADCAQLLTRNADVEAPALKGSIARLHADIAEYARRDAPAVRAAAEARQRFEAACAEFDMPTQGDVDFQKLLAQAVERRVPELLAEAVRKAKVGAFSDAVTYYEKFAEYVQDENTTPAENNLCASVRKVVMGNEEELTSPLKKEVTQSVILDLDIGGVDWGIAELHVETTNNNSASEIDWGIEIDASGTAEEASPEVEDSTIDKSSKDASDAAPLSDAIDWNDAVIAPSEAPCDENVRKTTEDTVTLADPKFREQYLNNLLELDAFLSQRAVELSLSGNTEIGLVVQQASGTPDFVRTVTSEEISSLLESVRQAIDAVNSAETRRLLALQSDSRRLERAARTVLEKKHIAERMHAAIDVLRQKRVRAVEDLANETPQLDQLAATTKNVKERTEKALSDETEQAKAQLRYI